MRRIKQYKFLAVALAVLALVSCNYEEINTNPFEMTDGEGIMDGIVVGGYITAMQKSVFPTGTQADDTGPVNAYQTAYNLSADAWSGYIGINNTFEGGNCHLNYVIVNSWVSTTFSNSYTNLLDPWKKLTASAKENDTPEIAALAQILKISGWHKVLESFGPIPYTAAGKGTIDLPFDSEETVYTEMLKDLAEAVKVLTPKAVNNVKVMSDYDLVFNGDVTKWVKYANSLMLRLAIRLRSVKPELAKQYTRQAVEHAIGVMTEAGDAAGAGPGPVIALRNPLYWIADNYNDARVGTSILAYLMGYKDPRLSAYCEPANSQCTVAVTAFDNNKYQGVPLGHTNTRSKDTDPTDSYYFYSKPKIQGNTPLYWMRASEVYFLRAEAALFWGTEYGKGDPETLYKQGIEISFQENGVTGSVDAYMASGNKPAANKVTSSKFGFDYQAPSQATAKFEGTQEQKLEKIIIQKYIALYPNGQEAWTEFRRTGYPKLNPIISGGNHNSTQITAARGMRRMTYPNSFNGTGQSHEIYLDAVRKLGGVDNAATDLWWAKKN